jgi:hypothetical protein
MRSRSILNDYKFNNEDLEYENGVNKLMDSLDHLMVQEGTNPSLIIDCSCELLAHLFCKNTKIRIGLIAKLNKVSLQKIISNDPYFSNLIKIILFIPVLKAECDTILLNKDYENHHFLIRSCVGLSHMIITEFEDIISTTKYIYKIQDALIDNLHSLLRFNIYSIDELTLNNVHLCVLREIKSINEHKIPGFSDPDHKHRLDNLVFLVNLFNWSTEHTSESPGTILRKRMDIERCIYGMDHSVIDKLTANSISDWRIARNDNQRKTILSVVCSLLSVMIVLLILMDGWVLKITMISLQFIMIIIVDYNLNGFDRKILHDIKLAKARNIRNNIVNWRSSSPFQFTMLDVHSIYMNPFEIKAYS